MSGACVGCQLASVTIHGIQAKLIAKLGMQLRVAPVLVSGACKTCKLARSGGIMRPVYLDNNATTRMDPAVLAAMLPYFTDHFGNASSAHSFGTEVSRAVVAARGQVQALIGAAHSHEIVFTSGGTEADNTAILSALETQPDRNEVVVSAVEHPAVLSLVMHLQRRRGVSVQIVPVDRSGRIIIEAYKSLLGPRTAIASIMWANNETGAIFPSPNSPSLRTRRARCFTRMRFRPQAGSRSILRPRRSTCSRSRAISFMGRKGRAPSMSGRAFASIR